MANFSLLRANLAAWVGAVLSSEFWAFDERISKTINASEGSTHAPTSPIVIGGDGIEVTGPGVFSDLQATLAEISGAVKVEMAGTAKLTYELRSIIREQSICDGHGNSWSMGNTSGGGSRPVWAADSNSTSYLWIRLRLPVGATLLTVRAYLEPAPGHAAVPATVPHVCVFSSPLGSAVATAVGTAAPAFSGTLAEYHAGYQAIAVQSVVIAADTTYWLRVKNESGADALAGLQLISVRTAMYITSQDEQLV